MSFLTPNHQSQSTNPNQQPGLILSSSTTRLATEHVLLPVTADSLCMPPFSSEWLKKGQGPVGDLLSLASVLQVPFSAFTVGWET